MENLFKAVDQPHTYMHCENIYFYQRTPIDNGCYSSEVKMMPKEFWDHSPLWVTCSIWELPPDIALAIGKDIERAEIAAEAKNLHTMIQDFDNLCEDNEYTDTDEAWQLFTDLRDRLNSLQVWPRIASGYYSGIEK